MHRIMILLLVALLLAACSQVAPSAEPVSAPPATDSPVLQVSPAPTDTHVPTVAPAPSDTPRPTETSVPTVTSEPIPTDTPRPTGTPTPTVDPASMDALQRGYAALLLLESSIGGIDELAAHLREGKIEGLDSGGDLMVLEAVLGAISDLVEAPPPSEALAPAWAEAQLAVRIATEVAGKWLDDEITSEEAISMLQPAAVHADKALDLAGLQLTKEYGITEDQMLEARQTAEAEFRAIFAETPTPVGSP